MVLVLSLVSLAAALVYGAYHCRQPASAVKSAIKTLAVACLALLALILGGPAALVLALGLSALGDYFISRDAERGFLAGMAAFLLAHLAYIALFLSLGDAGLILLRWRWAALLLAASAGLLWLIWRGLGNFRAPVVVYTLVILAMGISALGLPAAGGPLLILTGAFLFILSDAVLAVEKFADPKKGRAAMAHLVWASYYSAQALILAGMLGA